MTMLTISKPNSLAESQERTTEYLQALHDLRQLRAVPEFQILYRIGENLQDHPYVPILHAEDLSLDFPAAVAASIVFGCFYNFQGALSHIRDLQPEDLYEILPAEVQEIIDIIQPIHGDSSLGMKTYISAPTSDL